MAEGSTTGVDSRGGAYQNEYKGEKAGKTGSTVAAGGFTAAKAGAKDSDAPKQEPGEDIAAFARRRRKYMDDKASKNEAQQQALTK